MKKLISGKVRDVYEVSDDKLVIVTTDRISAFDVILAKPIRGKGKVLSAASLFWFDYTKDIIPNHIISSDLKDMPAFFQTSEYEGRTLLVKKLKMIPFECVVRGYIFGHMWEAYQAEKPFCGRKIIGNYKLAGKLPIPLFTPSTKAKVDEYTSFQLFTEALGSQLANQIKEVSLNLYAACYKYAYGRGLIVADTKFEFGLDENNNLILADEIFTPDSSRVWSFSKYQEGISPESYDKQLIRDWLQNNKKCGKMQFDRIPDEIIHKTSNIYSNYLKIVTSQGDDHVG